MAANRQAISDTFCSSQLLVLLLYVITFWCARERWTTVNNSNIIFASFLSIGFLIVHLYAIIVFYKIPIQFIESNSLMIYLSIIAFSIHYKNSYVVVFLLKNVN